MKRKIFSIILCVALVAALMIGCGKDNTTANNNETQNEENNNTPADNNDDDNDGDADDNSGDEDEDEDNNDYPFVFHLDYVTDENLAQYANHAEVVVHNDDYSCKILVTVDETITDVKVYALQFIDFDSETGNPIYDKKLVGQFESITPEMPLVIQQTYGEFMPTCGFSYVDADGVEHMIGITESGLNGNPTPGNIR